MHRPSIKKSLGNVWRSETIVFRMKMQCNVERSDAYRMPFYVAEFKDLLFLLTGIVVVSFALACQNYGEGKKECCGLVHYHLWSLKLFKIWHFYKKNCSTKSFQLTNISWLVARIWLNTFWKKWYITSHFIFEVITFLNKIQNRQIMVIFQKFEGKTTTLKNWIHKFEEKTTTLIFWFKDWKEKPLPRNFAIK